MIYKNVCRSLVVFSFVVSAVCFGMLELAHAGQVENIVFLDNHGEEIGIPWEVEKLKFESYYSPRLRWTLGKTILLSLKRNNETRTVALIYWSSNGSTSTYDPPVAETSAELELPKTIYIVEPLELHIAYGGHNNSSYRVTSYERFRCTRAHESLKSKDDFIYPKHAWGDANYAEKVVEVATMLKDDNPNMLDPSDVDVFQLLLLLPSKWTVIFQERYPTEIQLTPGQEASYWFGNDQVDLFLSFSVFHWSGGNTETLYTKWSKPGLVTEMRTDYVYTYGRWPFSKSDIADIKTTPSDSLSSIWPGVDPTKLEKKAQHLRSATQVVLEDSLQGSMLAFGDIENEGNHGFLFNGTFESPGLLKGRALQAVETADGGKVFEMSFTMKAVFD